MMRAGSWYSALWHNIGRRAFATWPVKYMVPVASTRPEAITSVRTIDTKGSSCRTDQFVPIMATLLLSGSTHFG